MKGIRTLAGLVALVVGPFAETLTRDMSVLDYEPQPYPRKEDWGNVGTLPQLEVNTPLTFDPNSSAAGGSGPDVTWDFGASYLPGNRLATIAFPMVGGPLPLPSVQVFGQVKRPKILRADQKAYVIAPWAWNWPGSTIKGGDWNASASRYKMVPRMNIIYGLVMRRANPYGWEDFPGVVYVVKAKVIGHRWMGDFTPIGEFGRRQP